MRIGLIANVQGNVHALDAVLAELGRLEVYTTLCAGDLVGYAAFPNEAVLRLRAEAIPCVLGNQDQAVAWGLKRANRTPGAPRTEILRRAALEWTQAQLEDGHRAYLRSLPRLMRVPLAGCTITVLHAGLDALDEQITPNDPAALGGLVARVHSDVMVLGHTHRAFAVTSGTTLVVNPGSVGRSVDGDPRAAFAVLDLSTAKVELCRLDYPVHAAIDGILASALPPEISLLVGRGLGARGEPQVIPFKEST
ncbi:metallophosphoesterase family protein [Deinococcus sp.]|uniref:metallophosphoesterase family protein n=1 Tax=Deinococcus sp. TaxID=47478 RepID=UPI0028698FE2|nr:metallophosphoesterase family protein [Deinococcus sp.]